MELILGRGVGEPGNEVDSSLKNNFNDSQFQGPIFPPLTRPKRTPAQYSHLSCCIEALHSSVITADQTADAEG